MAAQYEVIFSSEVVGSGIIAGGMYYCTEGSELRVPKCGVSPKGVLGYDALAPDVNDLAAFPATFFKQGKIDDPANLVHHRVFMWSGSNDYIVETGVMQATVSVYQKYGLAPGNIVTNFTSNSGHGWPTLWINASSCSLPILPWMAGCNRDVASDILNLMWGAPLPHPRGVQVNANLFAFDQSLYVPAGISLSDSQVAQTGYIYIPTACSATPKALCKLHIAFHGCTQSYNTPGVGDTFVRYTGLNEWAESNSIVVLYPQIQYEVSNPGACWDYTGGIPNSFYNTSGQAGTVHNIVKKLMGGTVAKATFTCPAGGCATTTTTTTTTAAAGATTATLAATATPAGTGATPTASVADATPTSNVAGVTTPVATDAIHSTTAATTITKVATDLIISAPPMTTSANALRQTLATAVVLLCAYGVL